MTVMQEQQNSVKQLVSLKWNILPFGRRCATLPKRAWWACFMVATFHFYFNANLLWPTTLLRSTEHRSLYDISHVCNSHVSFLWIPLEMVNNCLCLQVIANMNAAYKQEKKNAKRRARNMPSITFKVTDPLFGSGESSSQKKLKRSIYLSFPVETVLATEQCSSDDKKSDLEYPLPISDAHWGLLC